MAVWAWFWKRRPNQTCQRVYFTNQFPSGKELIKKKPKTGKRRTGRRLNELSICHIQYEPLFFFSFWKFCGFFVWSRSSLWGYVNAHWSDGWAKSVWRGYLLCIQKSYCFCIASMTWKCNSRGEGKMCTNAFQHKIVLLKEDFSLYPYVIRHKIVPKCKKICWKNRQLRNTSAVVRWALPRSLCNAATNCAIYRTFLCCCQWAAPRIAALMMHTHFVK